MSDHIKTSEQRKEERRAGAVDSAKDQALSKDSLQHVPATAGRTEIIAAAADIQAARHSVATGPATASSSTPDRGEPDQEQWHCMFLALVFACNRPSFKVNCDCGCELRKVYITMRSHEIPVLQYDYRFGQL